MATRLMGAYTRAFERSPYATLLITNGVLMGLGDVTAQTLGASLAGTAGTVAFDSLRTLRFLTFGASMGPMAGAWNKYLEVNFPLRPASPSDHIPMKKVKVESPLVNPIPEMKLPAGARLERGTGGTGRRGSAEMGEVKGSAGAVSVKALLKRVGADQFFMCVPSLSVEGGSKFGGEDEADENRLGLSRAPVSLFIFLFSMSILEGLDGEETIAKIKFNYFPILFVNWQVWPILQLINFRYIPLKYRVPFGSLCGIAWTCFLSVRMNPNRVGVKAE
ncbi:protein Mpv17 [Pseudohyphozyma bogoriensis]|nr:protein Mpv17 [Pseudohyphozyma bogoriensis]